MQTHILSVLVENQAGVLARVSSLFSRRGYNIEGLSVGPTENPEISRITISVNVEGHALDQVIQQLDARKYISYSLGAFQVPFQRSFQRT